MTMLYYTMLYRNVTVNTSVSQLEYRFLVVAIHFSISTYCTDKKKTLMNY